MEQAVTGILPAVLLEAAAIAIPLSFGLLIAYRRAVDKRIRAIRDDGTSQVDFAASMTTSVSEQGATFGPASITTEGGIDLRRELIERSARSHIAVVAGGVAYGLVLSVITVTADGEVPNVTQLAVLTTIFGFSGVLVGHLTSSRNFRRQTWITYGATFVVVSVIATMASTAFDPGQMLLLWAIFAVPPTALAIALAHPRIVAVGPLVFAFAIIAGAGANAALVILNANDPLLSLVVQIASAIGLGAVSTFVLIIVVGFGVLGVAAWFVLRWVGRSYDRKLTSSQLLVADSVMLIFTVTQGVIALAGSVNLIPVVLLAFGAYWMVTRTLMKSVGRRAESTPSRQLLILRPFSLGRRHARTFEAITREWRFVGSVQVIVGPDLTSETVEPDEFLDFIAGKLDRHFVDGSKPISRQLDSLDFAPDSDGRYRINQVLCYSDIWRQVFVRLARLSHVVVMDLRGFSKSNEGTKYEISTICDLVPLSRVLFLVDQTTDSRAFRDTVRLTLTNADLESPNAGRTFEELQMLDMEDATTGREQAVPLLCDLAA